MFLSIYKIINKIVTIMGKLKKKNGFTLIEVIVTLVLVGILATMAGYGLTQAARAFLFSKDAYALSQKSQLVLERMKKTFINISAITQADDTSVTVEFLMNRAVVTERFQISNSNLEIVDVAVNRAYVFTDNVVANAGGEDLFSYFRTDGTAWTIADGSENLAKIRVSVTIKGPNNFPVNFNIEMVPRNLYRPISPADLGAVSGGSEEQSAGGCFINSVF